MKMLSEEVITEKARTEIIAVIAIQVRQHTEYPLSEEYNDLCRKLIERYPFLKDKVENDNVSLVAYESKLASEGAQSLKRR